MSRFLLPISRNWIGEEFYGTKYALSVAAPHAVSPFLYAKCVLFASGANPNFPRAAAYCNGFLQALRSGAMDSDLVQYVEHFDRSALGRSPGLRKKDENELKIIRTLTPMQHRTMIYDAVKAAMYLRGCEAPNSLKQLAAGRRKLMERLSNATSDSSYAEVRQKIEQYSSNGEFFYHTNGTVYVPLVKAANAASMSRALIQQQIEKSLATMHEQFQQKYGDGKNLNSVNNSNNNSNSEQQQQIASEDSQSQQLQEQKGSQKLNNNNGNLRIAPKKSSKNGTGNGSGNGSSNNVDPDIYSEQYMYNHQHAHHHRPAVFHQPVHHHHHNPPHVFDAITTTTTTTTSGSTNINNSQASSTQTSSASTKTSSSSSSPCEQQQHPHQKLENIHTPNATYDESLDCLREIFGEKELCDLDVLGRELGLAPDVVVKACEIALRERDLTARKARLFDDLM